MCVSEILWECRTGLVCLFWLRCVLVGWLMYMHSILFMGCDCSVDLNEICSTIWGQECANLVLPVSITILSRKWVLSALCLWISMAIHFGRFVLYFLLYALFVCMLLFEFEDTHWYVCICPGGKGVLLLFEEWAVQVWCYVQISSPWTGWFAVSSTITRSGCTTASSNASCTVCLSARAVSICTFVTAVWSNTSKVSNAVKPLCSQPLWSYVGLPRDCTIPKLESLPSMCSSVICHFVSFYPCT